MTGTFGMADVDGDGRADAYCHDAVGTSVSLARYSIQDGYVGPHAPVACSATPADPHAAVVRWAFGSPTSILPGWCTGTYQKFSSAR